MIKYGVHIGTYLFNYLIMFIAFLSSFTFLAESTFLFDIILPLVGFIIIIGCLLSRAGPSIYKELATIFYNIFNDNFGYVKKLVDIYFIISCFSIFITYSFFNMLVLFYDSNIYLFLLNYLPFMYLFLLSIIYDKSLIRQELTTKIAFFMLIFLVMFIFAFIFGISCYLYEPTALNLYFGLFLKIRFLIFTLMFVYLIYYIVFMPWTRDNFLKLSLLISTIWILGTFFNNLGKIGSIYFNYMINSNVNKEDKLDLSLKNLNSSNLSSYNLYLSLKNLNTSNLSSDNLPLNIQSKRSILDIMPPLFKSIINCPRPQQYISFLYLSRGKISFNWFNGLLVLNKPIVTIPLLESNFVTYSKLLQDYSSKLDCFCIRNGIWYYRVTKSGYLAEVTYNSETHEGSYAVTSQGTINVTNFRFININNLKPHIIITKPFYVGKYKLITWGTKAVLDSGRPLYFLIDPYSRLKDYLLIDSVLGFKGETWTQATKYEEVSILISAPMNFQSDYLFNNPIRTNRLIIRPLKVGVDSLSFALLNSDPISSYYNSLTFGRFSSTSLSYQVYDDPSKGIILGVFLKDDVGNEGKLIGRFSIHTEKGYIPSMSYMFLDNNVSQGYGGESFEALLNYYFSLPSTEFHVKGKLSYLNIPYSNKATKLITIDTFWFNVKSMSLLRKFGFKLDYLNRQFWYMKHDDLVGRAVSRLGLDVFTKEGMKLYRELEGLNDFNLVKNSGLFQNRLALRPLIKYEARLILSNDFLYFSKERFTYKRYTLRRFNLFNWSLCEDDFYKNHTNIVWDRKFIKIGKNVICLLINKEANSCVIIIKTLCTEQIKLITWGTKAILDSGRPLDFLIDPSMLQYKYILNRAHINRFLYRIPYINNT